MSENTCNETETKLHESIVKALLEYHSNPDWINPQWGMSVSTKIPGYVVLVSVNGIFGEDPEPSLHIYTWERLEVWYERALQYLKEHPISPEWDQDDTEVYDEDDDKKCTLAEAMRETEED